MVRGERRRWSLTRGRTALDRGGPVLCASSVTVETMEGHVRALAQKRAAPTRQPTCWPSAGLPWMMVSNEGSE